MTAVTVDLSDVHALLHEAERRLTPDAVARDMRGVLRVAARNERAQHAYQNRTGRLQASTRGEVLSASASGGVHGVLYAGPADAPSGVPYASFVLGRGLMVIDDQAEAAEMALERIFGRPLRGG